MSTGNADSGGAVSALLSFARAAHQNTSALTVLEQAPDPSRYRNAVGGPGDGVDGQRAGILYFMRALDLAKAGFVSKQSAGAGLGTVKKVMGPVVHNMVGRLDKEQLLIVAGHIRQLMT